MALAFQYRGPDAREGNPARVAILPGAWNPPTIAHLAIARAALQWADEVLLTLPRALPHKDFAGVAFGDRMELLCRLAGVEPGMSVASVEGGLYLEMADEAAEYFGPGTEIGLVCGRDAAERIAGWDYGRPGVFEEMIARYPLLVASRAGEYVPATEHTGRIIQVPLASAFNEVSSTEIRRRMLAGEEWRDLVPEAILSRVAELYATQDQKGER